MHPYKTCLIRLIFKNKEAIFWKWQQKSRCINTRPLRHHPMPVWCQWFWQLFCYTLSGLMMYPNFALHRNNLKDFWSGQGLHTEEHWFICPYKTWFIHPTFKKTEGIQWKWQQKSRCITRPKTYSRPKWMKVFFIRKPTNKVTAELIFRYNKKLSLPITLNIWNWPEKSLACSKVYLRRNGGKKTILFFNRKKELSNL